MNHKNATLAIAAIVAAVAMTAVAFAIPQQASAYGHHNHNSNSIKVDQQINQLNACTTPPSPTPAPENRTLLTAGLTGSSSSTVCLNFGDNSADIHK